MPEKIGSLMRQRLRKFLPIVLIALIAQIFAPIGACWAASLAASDPVYAAAICHDDAASTSGQSDQTGGHRAHDGSCSLCCVTHAGASVDTPQTTFTTPSRHPERVVWRDSASDPRGYRTRSHAQARAPPATS
jgi:hypothetical protein